MPTKMTNHASLNKHPVDSTAAVEDPKSENGSGRSVRSTDMIVVDTSADGCHSRCDGSPVRHRKSKLGRKTEKVRNRLAAENDATKPVHPVERAASTSHPRQQRDFDEVQTDTKPPGPVEHQTTVGFSHEAQSASPMTFEGLRPDLAQISATLWNIYRQQLFQLDVLRHLQQQVFSCAAATTNFESSSSGLTAAASQVLPESTSSSSFGVDYSNVITQPKADCNVGESGYSARTPMTDERKQQTPAEPSGNYIDRAVRNRGLYTLGMQHHCT